VADLATHLCTALLPAAILGYRRVGPIAVGTVLPDLISRVLPMALEAAALRGWPVPNALIVPWGVLHEPIPLALVCVLLASVAVERERREVLIGLWVGCALHLALDLFQDHHGHGYYLLAPLWLGRFEIAAIGSEATVPWAPWLAGLTFVAWAVRHAVGRRPR
jgi:hypothetical protein